MTAQKELPAEASQQQTCPYAVGITVLPLSQALPTGVTGRRRKRIRRATENQKNPQETCGKPLNNWS